MIRVDIDGLSHYRFASFEGEGLVHAVFSRLGGCSRPPFASLNVGRTAGDEARAVATNHQRIYDALGVRPERVVTARQVHGSRVAVVGQGQAGTVVPDADALLTDCPDVWLLLRFADCVPLLFYAPGIPAVGLAHAGWRGTAHGIAADTVARMGTAYGCRADELYVGIGPSIGACCYEVGREVAGRVCRAPGVTSAVVRPHPQRDKAYVDLWQANAEQLADVGVRHVEVAGLCTRCHRDLFFSHRGDDGKTGRFAAVIGLRSAEHGGPRGLDHGRA